MILTLGIIAIVLTIALWISAMLVWWRSEQEKPIKTIKRGDVIRSWNKAARLSRRSLYGTMRYSKQLTAWGNKKARNAFVAIFPRSKSAFVKNDMLTGLEHGPSSYYLANLSKPKIKKKVAVMKAPVRRKKVIDSVIDSAASEDLSGAPTDLSE